MKKLSCLLLSMLICFTALCACAKTGPIDSPSDKKPSSSHNDLNTECEVLDSAELVAKMGLGWNLGNTLDAPDGENAWGQPTTTQEMIDAIKELGFNTIRIPVSWGRHTDEEFNIDPDWIRRVQDIVDYAMSNDMFVIINSHHDNDYYYPTKTNDEEQGEKFITAVWTQISEYFKDYDQHLIFECMNEPRLEGTDWEWSIDLSNKRCARAVEIINKYNQLFVDIVRASGGRNADRFLMASCYAGNSSYALIDEYVLPTDTVTDRLLLSVHAYTPYNLAMGTDMSNNKFTSDGKSSINWLLKNCNEKFVSQGVPVVITEMGCINKANDEQRYDWAYYYISKAKEYGIACIWWDNGHDDLGEETYGLFDRNNLCIYQSAKKVYQGLIDGYNS